MKHCDRNIIREPSLLVSEQSPNPGIKSLFSEKRGFPIAHSEVAVSIVTGEASNPLSFPFSNKQVFDRLLIENLDGDLSSLDPQYVGGRTKGVSEFIAAYGRIRVRDSKIMDMISSDDIEIDESPEYLLTGNKHVSPCSGRNMGRVSISLFPQGVVSPMSFFRVGPQDEDIGTLIPQIVHRIWIGESVTEFDEYWSEWQALNSGWQFVDWNREAILNEFPSYASIMPEDDPVRTSDVARVLILQKFGGLYVDADFKALRPLTGLFYNSKFVIGRLTSDFFSNAFIATEPRGDLIGMIVQRVTSGGIHEPTLGATGPVAVTEAIDHINNLDYTSLVINETPIGGVNDQNGILVLNRNTLFPYMWDEALPDLESVTESIAIHIWKAPEVTLYEGL